MPRGMDGTFHRLLWITLAAVAFTFTVILTSIFVDIDDLLAKRRFPVMKQFVTEAPLTVPPTEFVESVQGFPSSEENTDENESAFRTKRSLESNNYHLRIKSPKIKKIITNRLATLLEELDEEESSKANNEGAIVDAKDKNKLNPKYVSTEVVQEKTDIPNIKDKTLDKLSNQIDHKDVIHLAMHNILLQGIIGHMDLNEVYKKVQYLIKNFETNTDNPTKGEISELQLNQGKPTKLMKIVLPDSYKEEENFFNELIKCEKLQKQISQSEDFKSTNNKEKPKDARMLIKTTIEITNKNGGEDIFKNSNENTTGSMKLLYNGKEIKPIDITDDKNVDEEAVLNTRVEENQNNFESSNKKPNIEQNHIKESKLNQAIGEYLRTRSIKFQNKYGVMTKGSYISKRLKRQIKIRYLDDRVTTEKSKRLKKKPTHPDDELYVEIETHFDGKGTKGEKKKKLVRTLIDKIQKAINSNVEVFDEDKIVQKSPLQVKKRNQNPIDRNELIINTESPADNVEHRHLNPISKTVNIVQPLTSVLDKSGDTWKKVYNGPGFLAASKSLNSAENGELDIDYNSVMKNGIPKRLQKPLNTENEELIKPNEYTNMSNVTLFLKDINGSGFSIGINQYADEPPDKETLKMFMGLENLIQTYHDHYDQTGVVSNESEEMLQHIADTNHEIKRRNINLPKINNNEWFEMYRTMTKRKNQEKNFIGYNQSSRHRRNAINVKIISNIKSKTKLNKFINTNPMTTKKIIHKSKRNKRQIGKIRIIASDRYPSISREDIIKASRENINADRAIVKDEEVPEVEVADKSEEPYDFIAPYSYNMNIPHLKPAYSSNNYDVQSLYTGLMSKYPHIFVENISRSKEFINVNPTNVIEDEHYPSEKIRSSIRIKNDESLMERNISTTNVDEIVNAILPTRNNFKVVVKLLPKNNTNLGPGYKEVHTLINKSYDKNGIRYVSSLNVSEVSKFESLNTTKEQAIQPAGSETGHQQDQIKLLLELHKERIDQQLEHLKIESQKLKQMIGHNNSNKNITQLINIFKKLGLKPIFEKTHFNLNDNNATNISNTPFPVTHTTTIKPLLTILNKEDTERKNILSSIKKSENITKEILEKIDKNTNTLQLFLQKMLDHQQSAPQAAVNNEKLSTSDSPKYFVAGQVTVNNEKLTTSDSPKYLIAGQIVRPALEHIHPNFTNSFPFIYAFQHPLTENKDKHLQTVANVVYHGHIHANKFDNYQKHNDFLKSVTNNLKIENKRLIDNTGGNINNTRFFIDELENDFKLVSNVNNRIPVSPPDQNNTTKNQ